MPATTTMFSKVRLRYSAKTQGTGLPSHSAEVSHEKTEFEKIILQHCFHINVGMGFHISVKSVIIVKLKVFALTAVFSLSSLHGWHQKRSYLLQHQETLDCRP